MRKNRGGRLVFAMRVSEALSFNEYWKDLRFSNKKPNLRGSKKQAFGDNIYFKDSSGKWHQEDSHHSNSDGSPNYPNIVHDTNVDRVLIGVEYTYWGGDGPWLPPQVRDYNGEDVCAGYGHKCRFSEGLVDAFIVWYHTLDEYGYCGDPGDWSNTA